MKETGTWVLRYQRRQLRGAKVLKTHVRRYKDAGHEDIPACAENARGYKHLPGHVVSAKEFRSIPAEDRCEHCENLYLIIRNKQRKEKGLPPVKTAFEGLD